jgi:predicted transcriptional regulator
MTVTLASDVESLLNELAQKRAMTPDEIVNEAVREKYGRQRPPIVPRDDWERRLLEIGTDCGVSPPHEAFTSEELYD